jgi:protein required for attachment to host cells
MQQASVPHDALLVIGDGRKALFLRNEGTPHRVRPAVERVLRQENPPTRSQGTDRPGRKPGADGHARSAIGDTDWHELAEERFAQGIAETLYRLVHTHSSTELVIVAPPRVLGELRQAMHPEVASRVVAEVAKDLTGHPLPEIGALLSRED